jgi:hypothetical protein
VTEKPWVVQAARRAATAVKVHCEELNSEALKLSIAVSFYQTLYSCRGTTYLKLDEG